MQPMSGGNELLNPIAILTHIGVKEGSVVADLGCGGAGHFVLPAGRLVGEDTTVYAVDILKTVLNTVASKARLLGINNIKKVWSNLELSQATNIAPDSLDFALLINVLFQSSNPEAMIKEAIRLLKPGGKLLIIDWSLAQKVFGPPVEKRIDAKKIQERAKVLGLKLVEEFAPGPYHYAFVFTK
jgi:ubiquinone/menaquinone biosynthesis C-methylase UbiE